MPKSSSSARKASSSGSGILFPVAAIAIVAAIYASTMINADNAAVSSPDVSLAVATDMFSEIAADENVEAKSAGREHRHVAEQAEKATDAAFRAEQQAEAALEAAAREREEAPKHKLIT